MLCGKSAKSGTLGYFLQNELDRQKRVGGSDQFFRKKKKRVDMLSSILLVFLQ